MLKRPAGASRLRMVTQSRVQARLTLVKRTAHLRFGTAQRLKMNGSLAFATAEVSAADGSGANVHDLG